MADIADHNPFGAEWGDLDVSSVVHFLASTIDDEPLHWEAKAGAVTPDHVRHAVTAFANREGGYLIVGAARDAATHCWALPGVQFPGTEPRTWLSSIIRSSISPPPDFDVHAWGRGGDLKAAVVRVQPNCGFLSMTMGRVYYRRPGESSYVENGAKLQAIHNTVQYRSRALPGGAWPSPGPQAPTPGAEPEALEVGMDRQRAVRALRRSVDAGKDADISIYVAASTNAVTEALNEADEAALADALDRITDAAAVLISYAPEGTNAERVIAALHDVFDLGQTRRGGVNSISREHLWLETLPRARALGALGIRVRHWVPLRPLILHEVSGEPARLWRYWFVYGDVAISRARLYYAGNSVLESSRAPLRLSAEQALRLPSLRPDAVTDEDALVTSVCEFDLVTNLVCVWEARNDNPKEAAYPYFAAWGGERVRPMAERVISDPACREALLPGIADRDLATLLRFVGDIAQQRSQGLGSWGFWDGFAQGKVRAFISEHPAQSA